MIKQLSSSDYGITNDFVDNSERVLKDTVKVLQTCMATLISTINENDVKQKQSSSTEQSQITLKTSTNDHQQSSIIQQKDSIIDDLNYKFQEVTQSLDLNTKKYEEEITYEVSFSLKVNLFVFLHRQSERVIGDQQKLIQNLQRELLRIQRRLSKVEADGIVQPSIMFTRLDAQRNEHVLKQAVDKGKVPETTVNVSLLIR
jgi:hypothetical protein